MTEYGCEKPAVALSEKKYNYKFWQAPAMKNSILSVNNRSIHTFNDQFEWLWASASWSAVQIWQDKKTYN